MFDLWNQLKGKKTYLLSLTCIMAVLLKAITDQAQGLPVDWNQVVHEVLTCLTLMALRHGVGQGPGAKSQEPGSLVSDS